MKTLHDFNLNGLEALTYMVATSPYGTLEAAVAALTVFSHPETVAQTGCKPFVRVIRNFQRRGEIGELNGLPVGFDDNKSPTDAFLWCNGIAKPRDVQFNHVYTSSQDPDAYTCLANICMGPSFLAKLTDTHAGVRRLLEYRAFTLYGWHPASQSPPEKPPPYDDLPWADPLPAVSDVAERVKSRMATKPKDRTVLLCRGLGWVFGDGGPEGAV